MSRRFRFSEPVFLPTAMSSMERPMRAWPQASGGSVGRVRLFLGKNNALRVEHTLGDAVLGVVDQQGALAAKTQVEHHLEQVRPT